MTQTSQDDGAIYAAIMTKAMRDPAFKAQLLSDPHAALKGAGFAVRDGMTIKVVENTDSQVHIVLPAAHAKLSNADLDKVAGGIDWLGWAGGVFGGAIARAL